MYETEIENRVREMSSNRTLNVNARGCERTKSARGCAGGKSLTYIDEFWPQRSGKKDRRIDRDTHGVLVILCDPNLCVKLSSTRLIYSSSRISFISELKLSMQGHK